MVTKSKENLLGEDWFENLGNKLYTLHPESVGRVEGVLLGEDEEDDRQEKMRSMLRK
jgi:hypothetical protein